MSSEYVLLRMSSTLRKFDIRFTLERKHIFGPKWGKRFI